MDADISDEGLMLQYRNGDPSAFDALYHRHRGALYRFILRSVNSSAVANDLYQDTWTRLIGAKDRYRPTAKFTTYLYRIARNAVIDHARRQGTDVEEPVDIADVAPPPELHAAHGEDKVRLLRAIAALPLEQRTALLLKEERGMSLQDIADTCGVERETIKSRLRYAVKKLRAALETAA